MIQGMEQPQTRNTVSAVDWWTYVERTARTDRQRDISDRTGLDPSAVSRWKSGHVPKADMVAEFARAYDRPVLEAFLAAGFLTSEEADEQPVEQPTADSLTNEQLVEAIEKRLRHGTATTRAGGRPASSRRAGPSRTARSADEAPAAKPRGGTGPDRR